jgi:hypothetical protein
VFAFKIHRESCVQCRPFSTLKTDPDVQEFRLTTACCRGRRRLTPEVPPPRARCVWGFGVQRNGGVLFCRRDRLRSSRQICGIRLVFRFRLVSPRQFRLRYLFTKKYDIETIGLALSKD